MNHTRFHADGRSTEVEIQDGVCDDDRLSPHVVLGDAGENQLLGGGVGIQAGIQARGGKCPLVHVI